MLVLFMINYGVLCFITNISAKHRVQNINLNQFKLRVNDLYKEDEMITTNFAPTDDEDVKNKAYLDKKLSQIGGRISYLEKDFNQNKMFSNKQYVEEVLIERAVKTSIQSLYDKGLFDNYDKADEVSKDYLFC